MNSRACIFLAAVTFGPLCWGADPVPAAVAAPRDAAVDSSTWVDHDAQPVAKPKTRKVSLYGYMFRQALVEPISHMFDVPDKLIWLAGLFGAEREREAVNVNAFDEVPNSTWFTNRNHVRSVPPREIREGPFGGVFPGKPWTVTDFKKGGRTAGFQIKDAEGRKWLIKLDAPSNPQCSSGAGTISSRLAWAAGYNVPLDQPVTFRREDLQLKARKEPPTIVASTGTPRSEAPKDDPPMTEEDLDRILERGARASDGRYYAGASLFLPGEPAGPIDLAGRRRDDANDRFTHRHRRELRGLYVFYSWLNNWDVKDHNTLDMLDKKSSYLTHNHLDLNVSLGAVSDGAKALPRGYEKRVDFPWTATRLVSLGFVVEPWRRADQETGIPAVGNIEAKEFHPAQWEPQQEVPAFREMTPRDAYWGAKLVASFSDEQIAAAIAAAGYEDPRASEYNRRMLIERRDKIARYWFDRVAPLDFFHVEGGVLRFHDLALDLGLTGPREYEVEINAPQGNGREPVSNRARLTAPEMSLPDGGHASLSLTLSVSGSSAKSVRVDLARKGSGWVVSRVRHA